MFANSNVVICFFGEVKAVLKNVKDMLKQEILGIKLHAALSLTEFEENNSYKFYVKTE